MIGSLTLSNLESVHTLIFSIVLYILSTIATPENRDSSYLENYICIVAFAPVLLRVSFGKVIKFL
jgi:hypothetical protein